jgi:hypothetical protein
LPLIAVVVGVNNNKKYKHFIIEIQCIWNVRAKVVLVIIGATGTNS